jgi:hypothetical protein
MAMDKMNRAILARLDALLDKAGIDPADFDDAPAPRVARELTPQEQQAIDNAPVVPVAQPPEQGPRVTPQNAPDMSSSVPPAEPVRGYDALNVAEVLDALKDSKGDRALIERVLAYEVAHKKRATVVDTLVGWNG